MILRHDGAVIPGYDDAEKLWVAIIVAVTLAIADAVAVVVFALPLTSTVIDVKFNVAVIADV